MNKFLEFALIGTTASGKSALAHEIALDLNGIILSLDSLCVYKNLDIISAKPSKNELKEVSYFGVDVLKINEHFNVGLFIDLYKKAKKIAQEQNKPLIIVGGTSFYLKTMLDGLSENVPSSNKFKLNYEEISAFDKDYKIAPNDTYRIQKFNDILSHIHINNLKAKNGDLLKPSEFLYQTKSSPIIKTIEIFDIILEKNVLLQKIAKRTDNMLKSSAIDECVNLYKQYGMQKPLKCIGAKECLEYYHNQYNFDTLVQNINTHTAQLAKRQRTFNKKFANYNDEKKSHYHILKNPSKTLIYNILNIP